MVNGLLWVRCCECPTGVKWEGSFFFFPTSLSNGLGGRLRESFAALVSTLFGNPQSKVGSLSILGVVIVMGANPSWASSQLSENRLFQILGILRCFSQQTRAASCLSCGFFPSFSKSSITFWVVFVFSHFHPIQYAFHCLIKWQEAPAPRSIVNRPL